MPRDRHRRPRIGLALGSGVARGWTHIGILRALRRMGVEPDVVAGASIGALVGGCHLAGALDALEDWARSLTRFRFLRYLDFRFGGGVIAGGRLTSLMREHLGAIRLEELDRPFVAVATDLGSGHEVWLRQGDLVEAVRASFSLPGVFPAARIDGRWLVDGALVNPVPVSICRALGAEMVIAVNLNADVLGKARRPGFAPQAIEDQLQIELASAFEGAPAKAKKPRAQDAPGAIGTMVSALNIVTDRIARSRLAGDPPDVHLAPRVGHIGLLEFHRAAELIEEGEAVVERERASLTEALVAFGALPEAGVAETETMDGAAAPAALDVEPAKA